VSLSQTEAKETDCSQELNELKLREIELGDDVAALHKENEAHVVPQLSALKQDIAEGRGDLARCAAQSESMTSSKIDMSHQIADLEDQVAAAKTTANAMRIELIRVKGEPDRAGKAVDAVRKAGSELSDDINRTKAAIAARDTELTDQESSMETLKGSKRQVEAKLAKYRADIDSREQEISNVERSLRSERTQYKDLLERRIDLQTEEACSVAAARTAENDRDAVSAAYERAKRELKRKTDAGNEVHATIPTIESQLTERKLELARLDGEGKELELQIAGMKRDMDVLLAQFMKTEGVEKKYREKISDLMEACTALEVEKDQWHKEEILCQKVRSISFRCLASC
jgi:chromosome segregation ATPase